MSMAMLHRLLGMWRYCELMTTHLISQKRIGNIPKVWFQNVLEQLLTPAVDPQPDAPSSPISRAWRLGVQQVG
jgi:hypothetical protein